MIAGDPSAAENRWSSPLSTPWTRLSSSVVPFLSFLLGTAAGRTVARRFIERARVSRQFSRSVLTRFRSLATDPCDTVRPSGTILAAVLRLCAIASFLLKSWWAPMFCEPRIDVTLSYTRVNRDRAANHRRWIVCLEIVSEYPKEPNIAVPVVRRMWCVWNYHFDRVIIVRRWSNEMASERDLPRRTRAKETFATTLLLLLLQILQGVEGESQSLPLFVTQPISHGRVTWENAWKKKRKNSRKDELFRGDKGSRSEGKFKTLPRYPWNVFSSETARNCSPKRVGMWERGYKWVTIHGRNLRVESSWEFAVVVPCKWETKQSAFRRELVCCH